MNIYVLDEFKNIERLMNENNKFADRINSSLPVHRLQFPLLWWKYFSSENGKDFGSNRERNFFGAKSWLKKLCFIVVEDNGETCGLAPFFISEVLLRGKKKPVKLLSFCADSGLIFYHDILVDERHRKETISLIFQYVKTLIKSENLLFFLGHVPDTSPNIQHYRDEINLMLDNGWRGGEATNCWRGGVYPWNIPRLCSALQSLSNKLSRNDSYLKSRIEEVIEDLKSQNSALMLFAETRKHLESEIQDIISVCNDRIDIAPYINNILDVLDTKPIKYPYLDLPKDADLLYSSLSSSKRYFYRRYMKKFINAGGVFENIASSDISSSDIKEYLSLHVMRWQHESAAVNKQTMTFHENLSLSMARDGYFRLFFAKHNDKRIAALSSFDICKTREFYYSGRTLDYPNLRAGKLLVLYAILDAIERGFKVFDFGYGGDEYKFDFTRKYKTLKSFFLSQDNSLPDLDKLFPMYERIVLEKQATSHE